MRHIFTLFRQLRRLVRDNSGSVFVEYLLLGHDRGHRRYRRSGYDSRCATE